MSEEEKCAIEKQAELFEIWQQTPNTKEELETIPTLSREDLKTEPRNTPTEIYTFDGREIIYHPLHTGGISYPELFFDASDADPEDLPYLRLFTDMLSEWDTEKGSVTDFRNRVKMHLGSFYPPYTPVP